jgi:carbamoyltransferase
MGATTGRQGPRIGWAASLLQAVFHAGMSALGKLSRAESVGSPYARERREALRQRLARGETCYLIGLTPAGHNTGVSLVRVSARDGIEVLCNHEEERFTAKKHCMDYPAASLAVLRRQLDELGLTLADIHAVIVSWDYCRWVGAATACFIGELPWSFTLLSPQASPSFHLGTIVTGMTTPRRLGESLGAAGRIPVIQIPHHENHAYGSYSLSPFAGSDEPVLLLVSDGAGDDGSISVHVAQETRIEKLYQNKGFWDSLGQMYGVLSSTQGGWPFLSSEGRFMGASAWGNMNRLTNPYYSALRDVFHYGPNGEIRLNRSLTNWAAGGFKRPYTNRLSEILGPPIPLDKMWHPDAVLRVEDIEHAPITRDRVDKAAAVQLVFEDALFHIVGHYLRKTKSRRIVLSGGTALNCVANMRVLEHFNEAWYERYTGLKDTRLHMWVPPVPNDEGVAAGAAICFAMQAGAPVGKPKGMLRSAFLCGLAPTTAEIQSALRSAPDIGHVPLGNVSDPEERLQVAELLAQIISENGVVGIFQGAAETGPRALGHRSILANPANRHTLKVLNSLVKFREVIRPLAPMATLKSALEFFELSPGGSDDDYNAYNYMILTAPAKPRAYEVVPAVIHFDGTSRVQIVRPDVDPFCHAYLEALGRRIGAEVSVNTSLNVGSPIAQTPEQAIETIRRSAGMHGLLMIGDDGQAFMTWHNVRTEHKDEGARIRQWVAEYGPALASSRTLPQAANAR